MRDRPATLQDVVDAILDLTRVTIASSEKFFSKSEAVRKLADMSVPPSRIAQILSMPLRDVTSAISKARKSQNSKAINKAVSE
jgi:hypothetical protein